ncbi:hypothetical protein [Acinetobacter guillouiae]|uniref:hypothetical protein n=1 Tax=Acinetobacter guillouiae TaxID=106649 RepID=UPI002FD88031
MAHREKQITNAESETGKQNKYRVTFLVIDSASLEDTVKKIEHYPLFVEIDDKEITIFEDSFIDPRDNLKYKLLIW